MSLNPAGVRSENKKPGTAERLCRDSSGREPGQTATKTDFRVSLGRQHAKPRKRPERNGNEENFLDFFLTINIYEIEMKKLRKGRFQPSET